MMLPPQKALLKARLFYAAGAVFITIIVAASLRHATSILPTEPVRPTYTSRLPSSWQFETERDANNHGLTSDQCDIAFPGLFKEIDTVVQSRRSKPITEEELTREKWPAGTIRVLVWDQQVS
jgi:hypothetical protein